MIRFTLENFNDLTAVIRRTRNLAFKLKMIGYQTISPDTMNSIEQIGTKTNSFTFLPLFMNSVLAAETVGWTSHAKQKGF
jgi:hypothetical protein